MKLPFQKIKFSRYILILLILSLIVSISQGESITINRAKILQELGFPTDTTEQIIEASQSEGYFARVIALELLTERIGKEAIPELKDALDDPKMEVRWRAAHLLGTLGDKSGLGQMQKDLIEFAPNNGLPVLYDPNVTDPNKVKKQEDKRNLRVYYALSAARVLAELGDRRGYDLAKIMALDGAWEAQRQKAIHVLVEIAKVDESILASEDKDPVLYLCAMAQKEKNRAVFGTLTSAVLKLERNIAERVLESALDSPYQTEEIRNVTLIKLEKARAIMN